MILLIIGTLIATLASAYCYRVGGMSYEQAQHTNRYKWLPKWCVKSWFRDINCTLISLIWSYSFLPHVAWWLYLISGILMKLALTTYWDNRKWINWMYPEDNFYLHGLGIGLAFLPIVIGAFGWFYLIGFILRCGILGALMGIWCYIFSNDFVEEYGRGSFIQLTLLILCWSLAW